MLILLVLLGVGAFLFLRFQRDLAVSKINSYEECVDAGLPVMQSYPSQCRTSDGRLFTQDIGNELEYINEIAVINPRPNQKISSPLKIAGQARGNWYFEASFPVELVDEQGNLLGRAVASAQDEWMTEDFVPFSAELTFTKSATTKGKLIIRNANPSGLGQNAKQLEMPVEF